MPGHYIYFISSLPMLQFEAAPHFSSEKFFQMCRGVISDSDIEILKKVTEPGRDDKHGCFTEKKWRDFDIALRNELVKVRAAGRRADPVKYMRRDGYADPSVAHIALHAHRMPELLEAEKFLDRERWRALDGLAVGHYFDLDILVIYVLKLSILERWNNINKADAQSELNKVLS